MRKKGTQPRTYTVHKQQASAKMLLSLAPLVPDSSLGRSRKGLLHIERELFTLVGALPNGPHPWCCSWRKTRWPSRKQSCSQSRQGCTPSLGYCRQRNPSSSRRGSQEGR